MDILDVRLLGHPQLLVSGVSLKLPKRSVTIPLAAYLLLHRDETVARPFLAFMLWADETEETALSELRRYIYQINKTLPKREDGQPWIRADDDVLRWNPGGGLRLDVAEFERLSASPATYEQAVSIYGGDLLGDAYDEWIVTHRERLRAVYFADLVGLIATHREQRDFRRAAGFAAQLLAADPWREDVIRSLMACRYEAGDGAGALAAFDAFAKRLRAELGVDPMPETLVVRDAIVHSAPLPASLAQQRPSNPTGVGEAATEPRARGTDALPFAGRDAELEQLRGAWVRAAHGGGGLVFVSGPAGIGKSRLVAELARSVEQEGGRICVGATTYSERFPYEGIAEALRYSLPFVASLDIDQLRFSLIAQLVPELTAWRECETAIPPVDPAREQARLLDAVGLCVAAMARPRPLLFILEDLHWAGADTAAAIEFLARRLSRSPVLIVATYRDEDVGHGHPMRAVVHGLRSEQPVQRIALRPLSDDAVRQIVARLSLDGDDRERIARIGYARSEGNPLFLTEALRDAVGRAEDGNVDVWAGTTLLRALIASRLASLSDGAREIASLAAIVGHGFDVDLLREVAGIDEGNVLDGLYELVDRHIVREAGARRRFDFAFTHHLIHAAVYDDIELVVRARRHRRIARIIGERSADARSFTAADLAFHLERGGDASAAAASYIDASRHAASLFANDDSIRHATKALALAADANVRARALLERERAYGRVGRTGEQAEDLEALRALSSESSDEPLEWETAVRTLAFERSRGDRERQEASVADLECRAASSGDERRRAEALLARADQLVLQTFHARAAQPATESLAINERLGDTGGQVRSLALLAEIATVTGNFERGRGYLDSLRQRSAGQPDKTVMLRAIATAAATALQRHRIDEAAALATEGLALARSIGDREEEANALQRLATALTWQGDFVGARRAFADAAEALSAIGHMRGLSHVLANELVLALRLGLLDEGERLGARVLAIVEKTGERRPLIVTKVNLSLARLLHGDTTGARRLAREALEVARTIKVPLFEGAALANLGNAERAEGNIEAGTAHILEGLRLREAVLDPTDLLDDRSDLALAYLQRGDVQSAVAAADQLQAVADQSTGGAFWPHYCFWAAAQVRRCAGDAVLARASLARAVAARDDFMAKIADAATRQAFLDLPLNREIAAAVERAEWPAHAGGAAAVYTGAAKDRRKGGASARRKG